MRAQLVNKYLEKHANYPAWIDHPIVAELSMIVVIPCYNEPDIKSTLNSLALCDFQGFKVEVLVVVNQSETEKQEVYDNNHKTLEVLKIWSHSEAKFKLFTIFVKDVPIKKAGVGYARKTGMDEAVRRLEKARTKDKIILCLDADTLVQTNYLQAVHDYFVARPKCPAASVAYAHPLDHEDASINQAILEYELHLRYYFEAQRWSGLQYAQQTVGSAMAVRVANYQKQGGMNTRKAGEDFYFIHKFSHYSDFGNITTTCVIPSARISDRVPFGTGRAMMSLLADKQPLRTYAPQSFAAIKKLVSQVPKLYEGDHQIKSAEAMSVFLLNHQFAQKLEEIKANTTDYASFQKRFFRWFDAFLCMKFLHFSRDHYHPNIPIKEAANWLNQMYHGSNKNMDELELLINFRQQINTY